MSEKNNNNHGGKRTGSGRKETSQIGQVKPIIIHLGKEEIESLNRWAKQEGVRRGALIRSLLQKSLDGFVECKNKPLSPQKRKSLASLHNLNITPIKSKFGGSKLALWGFDTFLSADVFAEEYGLRTVIISKNKKDDTYFEEEEIPVFDFVIIDDYQDYVVFTKHDARLTLQELYDKAYCCKIGSAQFIDKWDKKRENLISKITKLNEMEFIYIDANGDVSSPLKKFSTITKNSIIAAV